MNQRILVADNDEVVRNGLDVLLSTAGYTTFLAVDGVSLIEQARKHQPHLIMFNLCLPAGTAIELVHTLRRFPEFTRTPILVFAGREYRTSANQVFEAGGNAFLPTPFNRQILFSLIAKFLPSEKILSSITPVLAVDPRQKQPVPFS